MLLQHLSQLAPIPVLRQTRRRAPTPHLALNAPGHLVDFLELARDHGQLLGEGAVGVDALGGVVGSGEVGDVGCGEDVVEAVFAHFDGVGGDCLLVWGIGGWRVVVEMCFEKFLGTMRMCATLGRGTFLV